MIDRFLGANAACLAGASVNQASVAPGSVDLIKCDDDLECDQHHDNQFEAQRAAGVDDVGERVGGIGNAPKDIRADQIVVAIGAGVRLRYVNCPFAPFLDTSDQDVCGGK